MDPRFFFSFDTKKIRKSRKRGTVVQQNRPRERLLNIGQRRSCTYELLCSVTQTYLVPSLFSSRPAPTTSDAVADALKNGSHASSFLLEPEPSFTWITLFITLVCVGQERTLLSRCTLGGPRFACFSWTHVKALLITSLCVGECSYECESRLLGRKRYFTFFSRGGGKTSADSTRNSSFPRFVDT